MAAEQILLSSSSFDGMRETGGFGQPLHTLYPQIRAVLAGQLGAEVADVLAEPVVDRARGRIDWYAEGDPDRPPIALADLAEEQRRPILDRIEQILGRGRELAERYAASGDVQRMQLGAILKAALGPAAETGIFLVEGRPVVTGWGFAPDRPWETPAIVASAGVLPRRPDPITPHDVAIPDIALPELAAEPLSLPELPPQAPPMPIAESLPPPVPEVPPEPVLPPPAATAPSGAVSEETSAPLPKSDPEPPLEPLSPPGFTPIPGVGSATADQPSFTVDAGQPAMAGTTPASPLRYVVVGSRYFWSVFILALLLALGTGLWIWMKKPVTDPVVGDKATITLTEAQRTETGLRARLETLLVQLTERRGQCQLPDGSVSVAPTVPQPDGKRSAIPAQSTVAVTTSGISRPDAAKAPVPAADAPTDPPGIDRSSTVLPARPLLTDPATAPRLEIPAGSLAASGRNSSDMPGGASPVAPARMPPGEELPAATARPATPATVPDVPVPPPSPASPAPAGTDSPARSLEEVLADRPVSPAGPVPQPPPVTAPVKAEPTPEERREFANRLSAAGAATGEITVALLWNGRSDLDLVVRCPSGRQLDYQHSAECGGSLDVDANAIRNQLSDRPVESAFWPAGKATPGNYQIAVRYAPRKDEANPGETPYQVRLSQGGQESTFKGVIRPHTTAPVTTFTVDR